MSFTTADSGAANLLPDAFAELVEKPLRATAVAYNPALVTPQSIPEGHRLRVPVVAKDPQAGWVSEGEEIPATDPEMAEVNTDFAKVAGLTIITREMANDSNPAALEVVGNGLARDLAKQVDAAFVGDLAAPAPAGLGSITPTTVEGELTDLDVFAEAISAAAQAGGEITGFMLHPADLLKIRTLKTADNALTPLLGTNAAEAGAETVFGVPILPAVDLEPGTAWAMSAATTYTAIREDIEIAVSEDAFFSSDSIAVRAVARIAFAFPAPEHQVKITFTDTAA